MTDLPLGVSYPSETPPPKKAEAKAGDNGSEPERGPLPYEVTPLTEGENVIPAKGANPKPTLSTWADLAETIGPIEWDWPRWLAKGFLHILAGASGKGKSSLALRIAACYLRGDEWPDGYAFTGERGKVLWIEAEYGQVLNMDRQRRWGLEGAHILSPFTDPFADVCLDNPQHQQAIRAAMTYEEVRLIVLDSLSGALGGRRDENDSRIIPVMKWLTAMARDAWVPLIVTHHLRKRGMQDVDGELTLDRLRGSTGITQIARIVWGLDTPDPMQPESLRLSVLKSNLAKFPQSIGLSIDEGGIEFTDAPEKPERMSKFSQAEKFLRDYLAGGAKRTTDVEMAAARLDISERTLKRARTALGIIPTRQGDIYWISLPIHGKVSDLPGF